MGTVTIFFVVWVFTKIALRVRLKPSWIILLQQSIVVLWVIRLLFNLTGKLLIVMHPRNTMVDPSLTSAILSLTSPALFTGKSPCRSTIISDARTVAPFQPAVMDVSIIPKNLATSPKRCETNSTVCTTEGRSSFWFGIYMTKCRNPNLLLVFTKEVPRRYLFFFVLYKS